MDLSAQLKALREEAGLSQSVLARELDLIPQAVWKWEHGVTAIPSSEIPKLATALGVSIGQLFGEPLPSPSTVDSAQKIKAARMDAGLSILAVADAIEVPASRVLNWESARWPASSGQLRRLATLFKVPVTALMGAGGTAGDSYGVVAKEVGAELIDLLNKDLEPVFDIHVPGGRLHLRYALNRRIPLYAGAKCRSIDPVRGETPTRSFMDVPHVLGKQLSKEAFAAVALNGSHFIVDPNSHPTLEQPWSAVCRKLDNPADWVVDVGTLVGKSFSSAIGGGETGLTKDGCTLLGLAIASQTPLTFANQDGSVLMSMEKWGEGSADSQEG